jgi:hypothetical protein
MKTYPSQLRRNFYRQKCLEWVRFHRPDVFRLIQDHALRKYPKGIPLSHQKAARPANWVRKAK